MVFGSSSLDMWVSPELKLNFSAHLLKKKMNLPSYWLSSPGELIDEVADEERIFGGSGTLTWYDKKHTLTFGVETNYGDLDAILHNGPFYQGFGDPPTVTDNAEEDDWAVFVNDTLLYDKWSITPGIRYDHNSICGSFLSPSIGFTYQAGAETILRGSIARGFTAPSLANSSIGGYLTDPNPDLDPEEVWSYRLGAESDAVNYLWIKTSLFYHRLSDEFVRVWQNTGTRIFINSGSSERKGIEVELATLSCGGFSLGAGVSFVHTSPDRGEEFNSYTYNVKFMYDKENDLTALLCGQYIQGLWDNDEFIWDLNFNKHLFSPVPVQIPGSPSKPITCLTGNSMKNLLTKTLKDGWK